MSRRLGQGHRKPRWTITHYRGRFKKQSIRTDTGQAGAELGPVGAAACRRGPSTGGSGDAAQWGAPGGAGGS